MNQCLTAKEAGFMYCNGVKKRIPHGLPVPETFGDFKDASDYYEDKEYRLFLCLKYNRCN